MGAGAAAVPRRRALAAIAGGALFALTARAQPAALRAGGTGSAIGTMRMVADALGRSRGAGDVLSLVPNLGTSGALKALQAGAIDLAFVARPLKPEEKATGLTSLEYGRSPFVIVTNRADLKSLTRARLAELVSGRAPAWPDGQPVRLVLRPRSDGDSALLAAMSPDVARALEAAQARPGMVVAATDQDAADEAERLPGSLGTSTLSLTLSEHRRLALVAIEGVAPSVKTLADGTYPYQKSFFLVTRGAPSGLAKQFVEFVRSREGRAILEANGHVAAP